MPYRSGLLAVGLAALASATAAQASETITYSYDAKGRLVKVEHAGSVNGNAVASYTFDQADNRKTATVSGARSTIVVPLGGYQVIVAN